MTGKSFKITIIVLISIFVAVILAIVFYAVSNGFSTRYMLSKIFPGTVENVYRPYKILETNTEVGSEVSGCDGYVYVLDGKNLTVYDSKGNEEFSEILGFDNPSISSGSEKTFIYDKSTGDYIVFKKGDMSFESSMGKSILGVFVNENNFALFILKGRDGYLGSACVLNDSNEVIATYNYADRFPVSGCVIGDSGRTAVTGIYESETNKTGIDIFEEYNNVPVAGLNRSHLMPLTLPVGDKAFITAGLDTVTVFSAEGKEISVINFNEIMRATASNSGFWIADRRTGSDKIIFIDKNGKEKWEYSTGLMLEGLLSGERHLFYWSGINAVCLDEKGNQVEIQSGFDLILGIADIGNGKTVIITTGKIVFYEYH